MLCDWVRQLFEKHLDRSVPGSFFKGYCYALPSFCIEILTFLVGMTPTESRCVYVTVQRHFLAKDGLAITEEKFRHIESILCYMSYKWFDTLFSYVPDVGRI